MLLGAGSIALEQRGLPTLLALPWAHAAQQQIAPLAFGEYQSQGRGALTLERANIPFFTGRTVRESPKEQRWQR